MTRGVYALASPDQKTVLKLMIMPRDEAGFDPEPFLRSVVAADFTTEIRTRVAATWHVMQLTFEAFDPTIGPALDFFLLSARKLAELTGGVVADPICRRYQLPEEVLQSPRMDPEMDAREHIVALRGKDARSAHTAGLIKFGLPEFQLNDLEPDSHLAETFLLNLCQAILKGNVPALGSQVGPFQVTVGGANRGDWEGIPVYELLPPTGVTTETALATWAGSAGS